MKKTKHRPSSRQNRIFQLVRLGSRIQLQITQLSAQLKPIEDMLRAEALKRPLEHHAAEAEGAKQTEWFARAGTAEFRINFQSPQLQEVFTSADPELPIIRRICAGRFSQLFTESLQVRITDPMTFQRQVAHLFTPDQSAQLLRHCSLPSEGIITWSSPTTKKGKRPTRRVLP